MKSTQYQAPGRDLLDKRLAAADRPGEHLWVLTAAWRILDPQSAYDAGQVKLLDLENILVFAGPGCYKCEKPYSKSMAKRRCLGSIAEIQP